MKTLFTRLMVMLIVTLTGLDINQASAQTPGLIFQPAINGGQKVLDPNGDGYVSLTTAGFPGINKDEGAAYSEIPYRPFPIFMNEPLYDIITGNAGGHTDYAPRVYETVNGKTVPVGSPLASYFDGTNFMFRVRLGGTSSASMAYSILIDTDGLFPGGTPNPGFEFEVVFGNNFDVRIYDHRTNTTGGDIIFTGSAKQYSHKAVAASLGDNNTDYFYDFYVPLSGFKGGITAQTPLRMSGVTVTSAKSGIYGSVSDIGGVDDRLYNGDVPGAWKDIIDNFPPTSLEDIQNGDFPPVITTPPVVNGPLYTNSTVINGTSVEAPGSVIIVYQNGVEIGRTTVKSDGSWVLPVPSGVVLVVGDQISAKVDPVDKDISALSNIVIVQQGTCEETATPPITSFVPQNDKGFSGVTSYYGLQTLTIYKKVGDVITSEIVTVNATTASTEYPGLYNWTYLYTNGKTVSAGIYYVTVTPLGKCESQGSNQVCYSGNGNTDVTTSRYPTITTINGASHPTTASLFLIPFDSQNILKSVGGILNGTSATNAVYLYKNDIKTTYTAVPDNQGNWVINTPGIKLIAGDVITVRAIVSSACGELLSIPSNPKIAAVRSLPPVITGKYCGTTTTISGTSTEAAGTRIRLYANGVLITNPAIPHALVNMQGYWTATGLNIAPNTIITATSIAEGELESAPSNAITVTNQQTITGFSLNSPVIENATTITGKAPAGTISGNYTVRLYIDGSATSYSTTIFAANGDWKITDIFAYDIYPGAKLTIRVSQANLCESVASNQVIVACKTETRPITATLSSTGYCYNTAATVNLSSSITGAAYSLFINGVQTGTSVAGTGYALSINTGLLTVNPTIITVREIKIGSPCNYREFGPLTAVVYDAIPNNYTLSASPDAGCPNLNTSITVQAARKGFAYQLINAATKQFIGAPLVPDATMIPGATGNITFPQITVPVTTTYGVIITNTTTGCSLENINTVTVTIAGPNITKSVWANNPVCAGNAATIFIDTEAGYTYTVYDKATNLQVGSPLTGNNTVQSIATAPLSPANVYTYYVLVTGGACPSRMLAEATAHVIESGTLPVSAGETQTLCRGTAATASTTLQGSDPAPGTGTWSVVTRPVGAPNPIFSNLNDRYASVSGLVSGDYIFKWRVVTACGSGENTVKITVNCPAVYTVVGPNYWDMFPDGSNLATAFDEDKGVVSATILDGYIPGGSRFDQNGNIVVDRTKGDLEPGNFYLTIRTIDFFGNETINIILITIYPRNAPPLPMPVELLNFKAVKEKERVVLHWQTASEKDNDRFEVKRSTNGKTFETIGTVKGAGTSSIKNSYSFTDNAPEYGTSYYMLKQIDYDGTFSHSKMETVTIKVSVENGIQFQVFPNPFAEELNLTVTTELATTAALQLVDLQGRVVHTGTITVKPGINKFTLPVQNVSPGIYMVRITGTEISFTTKVVKTQ